MPLPVRVSSLRFPPACQYGGSAAYNENLEAAYTLSPDSVSGFDVSGGRLYLLSDTVLTAYNEELQKINSYELDDTYSDVRIIGGSAYLLGYNTVQKLTL